MNLSLRRSECYQDEVKNPYRENDFMSQWQFEASRKSGRSDDPGQFWLEQLLYLLETSYEDLLADTRKTDDNAVANTYKSFIEDYALQIWKAADGYEFFLNERLVDFEGDTESRLGVERKEAGSQLAWMIREGMIHLVLPISPEVAVMFCNESRCWESPFTEITHQLKAPYPENSHLKDAPHVDVVNIHVPSERRRRKIWPATVAWRVNIGTLSRYQHRIIASYSLGHARSLVVVRSRKRFERAKRELEVFTRERVKTYEDRGSRFDYQYQNDRRNSNQKVQASSGEQKNRMVEDYRSDMDKVFATLSNANEIPRMTKENIFKFWMTFYTVQHLSGIVTSLPKSDNGLNTRIMHPGLKTAFEAAYPTKPPDHRDLNDIDFWRFFEYGMGETTFAQLFFKIEQNVTDLVAAEAFGAQFEASRESLQWPVEFLCQENDYDDDDGANKKPSRPENDLLRTPSFQSIYRAAQCFEALMWMYVERQDILATFVQQIALPTEDIQPHIFQFRSRRE